MPSFAADIVLRALIEDEVYATVGPDYMGQEACAEFADKLGVPTYQLWGTICSLRSNGYLEGIRAPEKPGLVALMPTEKGQRFFNRCARMQPYPRERCRRAGSSS